jgi:hypothetical protein
MLLGKIFRSKFYETFTGAGRIHNGKSNISNFASDAIFSEEP